MRRRGTRCYGCLLNSTRRLHEKIYVLKLSKCEFVSSIVPFLSFFFFLLSIFLLAPLPVKNFRLSFLNRPRQRRGNEKVLALRNSPFSFTGNLHRNEATRFEVVRERIVACRMEINAIHRGWIGGKIPKISNHRTNTNFSA